MFSIFQCFRREFFTHGLERWVATLLMQLRDNVGDRVTYAWNFLQAILGHYILERLRQGDQVLGRPRVGLRAVGVATA